MTYLPTTPVPAFRKDIQLSMVIHNGEQQICAHDTFGYASEEIYLSLQAYSLIQLFDNCTSVQGLSHKIFGEHTTQENIDFLCNFIGSIDEYGYLESDSFEQRRRNIEEQYAKATVREPVCAGGAYPSSEQELRQYLDTLMAECDVMPGTASGIIVPHIDYRVGGSSYPPAFKAIEQTNADVYIVFATSHYWWGIFFILTEKDFRTPLGIVKTDTAIVKKIREYYPHYLTNNDMPHKPEHSIELELPFLQYIRGNSPFTIVPILVTSFHRFMNNKETIEESAEIHDFIYAVRRAVEESGKKAVYISSGDLSHIGRKFGDKYDAISKLSEAEKADKELLQALAACDGNTFFRLIADVRDTWKICGCSPDYMLLQTLQPTRGEIMHYAQWDERERASAVTFGSLAFYH
jgi:AmmeMemoRadiSam system protein B